jgi:hypothetical protein
MSFKGDLLPSAARTATATSAEQVNQEDYAGLLVVFDITVLTAGASLVAKIQGKDPAGSGNWYDIISSAAKTAVGTSVLEISPELTAAANVVANDHAPHNWRVVVTPADAKSVTYSVSYKYLPVKK